MGLKVRRVTYPTSLAIIQPRVGSPGGFGGGEVPRSLSLVEQNALAQSLTIVMTSRWRFCPPKKHHQKQGSSHWNGQPRHELPHWQTPLYLSLEFTGFLTPKKRRKFSNWVCVFPNLKLKFMCMCWKPSHRLSFWPTTPFVALALARSPSQPPSLSFSTTTPSVALALARFPSLCRPRSRPISLPLSPYLSPALPPYVALSPPTVSLALADSPSLYRPRPHRDLCRLASLSRNCQCWELKGLSRTKCRREKRGRERGYRENERLPRKLMQSCY